MITSVLSIEALRSHTSDFLANHWQQPLESCMAWVDAFPAAGPCPIKHHDHQGCYALFKGSKLCYIGLAASRGWGPYKGHGIGARIKHVLAIDWGIKTADGTRFYKLKEAWSDVTHISTFGFPSNFGYLAPALESYILTREDMQDLQNKNRPGAA